MFFQNMLGPTPWYLYYWYFLRDIISKIPDIETVRILLIELIMNILQTQMANGEFTTKTELASVVNSYQSTIDDLDLRIESLEAQSLALRQTLQQRGLCKTSSLPPISLV